MLGLRESCASSHLFGVLKKSCNQAQLGEAIEACDTEHKGRIILSTDVFYSVLQDCISGKDLILGRAAHHRITKCGLDGNAFLGSHLIRMYAICGSLREANQAFTKIPEPTVFTWHAVISAQIRLGQALQAIKMYHCMWMSDVKPDQHVFVAVLKACADAAALSEGKQINAHIIANGFASNVFVSNTLVDMYVKCHSLQDARSIFDEMSCRDVVTWTAMIAGYAQHGYGQEAIELFQRMLWEGVLPNNATYISSLKACSDIMDLDQGQFLHACVVKTELESDVTISNTLIDMYGKCGRPEDACVTFNNMPKPDVVTFNALIAAYAQHGQAHEALCFFQKMQQEGMNPDHVTIINILKACSSKATLHRGKTIHVNIGESGLCSDLLVDNTLIDMYAKCGSIRDAQKVFEELPMRDVVTWNTLIAGYLQHKHSREALQLFHQMQLAGTKPDRVTFVSSLKACSSLAALDLGRLIQIYITESGFELDLFVCSSLMDMYTKCGRLEDACSVFDRLPQQNVVAWNVMIAGYAQLGHSQESLRLFDHMQQKDMEVDSATFVSTLKACSTLAALDQGKLIHAHATEAGFALDLVIGNALVDMYIKCGSPEDARTVFHTMPNQDVVTWTTLIAGYGQHSDYQLALHYFETMQREGLKPIDVTFVCMLSACSHAGLLEDGFLHFKAMSEAHGLRATVGHYCCMVDLIGRTGRLMEAEDLLQTMPFVGSHIMGLRMVLSHCKVHGNVELGSRCFAGIISQDPRDASVYVLMSNIYADAGMWEVACEVEYLRMQQADAWKKPGTAVIEVGNKVHDFITGDNIYVQSDIDLKLQVLCFKLKEGGYIPWLESQQCVT